MARFSFRQGIARRQEDGVGNPNFLQPSNGGSYVDLLVTPDPTVFIIAHYDVDYMLTENATVQKAWGPFTSNIDYWLYWDVDFIKGNLTRGFTTLEPTAGPKPPTSPQTDQHWFDTNQTVMKVWSGSSWIEKIRVFAAKYQNGATVIEYPVGSQVGISDTETYAGVILFDPDGKPLQKFQRNRRGQFITTETALHSQFARIANFRVEAAIVQGEAQENIPIHHAIAYYDYDKLILAKNTEPETPAIGLAAEDMNTGENRSYITKGFVTNEVDWDWSAYPVGTPLFVGATGELTPTPPTSVSSQQIAKVINETTVFVDVQPIIVYSTASIGNLVPIQIDKDTGNFIARPVSGGGGPPATILSDLNDVTVTSVTDDEVLAYDAGSGSWINQTPSEAGLAAVSHTHDASDIVSGTFADSLVAQSNVVQHQGAIDHNALLNYVADEHIDHSAIFINAGEGLSGGGNLTATRTLNVDIDGLTADGTPDSNADYLMTYDASSAGLKKVLLNDLPTSGAGPCGTKPVGALCTWGYAQVESTPSTTWTITHNIGTDKVLVQIYDTSGRELFPNDITIADINTVVVSFNTPQDGLANLVLLK